MRSRGKSKPTQGIVQLAVVLLLILLAVGAFIGWYFITQKNQPSLGKRALQTPSTKVSPDESQKVAQKPSTSGKIILGPFFFGERASDYTFEKDGILAGSVFGGGMISITPSTSTSTAESLFEAAKNNSKRLLVSAAHPKTCYYWDGSTFNQSQMLADVERLLPSISKYQDVIMGINLLDEPHDPTSCPPLPAQKLYDAAKEIRAKFSSYGLPQDFPLGYGSPPFYYKSIPADGTINLSTTSYVPKRGSIASFLTSQESEARSLGHKLYFYDNGQQAGTNLDDDLLYLCENADPSIVLMIGYWKWDQNGGNQKVPLTDLIAARDACTAR